MNIFKKFDMQKLIQLRWYIFVGFSSLISLTLFSASYFFDKVAELPFILAIYFITAFIFWIIQPIGPIKKFVFIFITFLISAVIGALLVFSTLVLPGSKNHDYVMYKICLPEIDKYYASKNKNPMVLPSDKNAAGEDRWWVQHLECEENVRKGTGPKFSENPPGFPVIK